LRSGKGACSLVQCALGGENKSQQDESEQEEKPVGTIPTAGDRSAPWHEEMMRGATANFNSNPELGAIRHRVRSFAERRRSESDGGAGLLLAQFLFECQQALFALQSPAETG
jgi:hypothetical protein